MLGGIEDNASNRIVPTPDVWQLNTGGRKCPAFADYFSNLLLLTTFDHLRLKSRC